MTRYDYMTPSKECFDPEDKQQYPDLLSVNFNKFYYNSPPIQASADDTFLEAPFYSTYALYGESSFDDIILELNKISHISLCPFDTTIVYPDKSDIIRFARKRV